MSWFDSLFENTDWGQVLASGASSFLGGRERRNESKDDWKRQLEMARLQFSAQREGMAQARQWELEDRRFRGDSMGNYAQFYTGPEVQRPGPIDTTVTLRDVPPELAQPAASPTKPKKKRKKKGFFSRLF